MIVAIIYEDGQMVPDFIDFATPCQPMTPLHRPAALGHVQKQQSD
jgi:hypothetical protein